MNYNVKPCFYVATSSKDFATRKIVELLTRTRPNYNMKFSYGTHTIPNVIAMTGLFDVQYGIPICGGYFGEITTIGYDLYDSELRAVVCWPELNMSSSIQSWKWQRAKCWHAPADYNRYKQDRSVPTVSSDTMDIRCFHNFECGATHFCKL